MDLSIYFHNECIAICMLLLIILFVLEAGNRRGSEWKRYIPALYIVALLFLTIDATVFIIDGDANLIVFHKVIRSIYLIGLPVFGWLWLRYCAVRLKNLRFLHAPVMKALLALILTANAAFVILSWQSGDVCSVTDKGVHVPGTWIWLPTMLMYGQMFFAAICSLIGAYQAKTVTERHTLLMQALHIVPLFVTGFVRLLLPSNMIVVTPQFNPQIVSEPPAVDRKAFDITVRDKAEAEERDILFALDVALRADAVYMAEHPERSRIVAEELNAVFADGRTDRSFTAKLILSSDELKRYYEEICAAFAGYTGVRKRVSWQHAGFSAGRHSLALVSIKGKTLYLYLALDPSEQAAKYYLKDVSDVKKYNKTPALFRVRSERGLKYAKELIATLAGRFELLPAAEPVRTETAYPKADVSDLIRRGLIRVEGAAASNLAEEEETVVPDETQTIDEPETIDELEVSGEENETDDEAEPAGDERPLTKADIPFSYHVGGPRKANAPEQTEGEKPEEYFGRVRPAGGMALPDVGPMSGEKVDSPDGGRMIRIDQTALSGEAEAAQTRQNMAAAVGQADDQSAEEEMDLSKIHRPQNMDYSRPTTVGVDDVTGFIADIEKEENAEEKKEKEKKKGLFSRIFNKKNGK